MNPAPGHDPSLPSPGGADLGTPDLARPGRRRVLGAGAASIAAILGTGALVSPRPSRLGRPMGDQDLADALAPHLTGQRTVSFALVDGDEVRFAGFGADEHREFEIGSVTKTFTAALVMDTVGRGELTLDTTVRDVLGEGAGGSAVADVTIRELASHTSGIPSIPKAVLSRTFWRTPMRRDPYEGFDAQQVVDLALDATPSGRGDVAYSNHGVALEGQLIARATGTAWEDLLARRLLRPLGLDATSAALHASELPTDAPMGHTLNGHDAGAWAMDGFAPAGGIRSTAADMATWLSSMMDGSNPGAGGLEPTARQNSTTTVGVNWFTTKIEGGRSAIWHNGETGGFHSFCGWSPETGRGWLLLSDTADERTDDLAMKVLAGEIVR